MKVIFVDFDGVLNSGVWTRERRTLDRIWGDAKSDALWTLEPAKVELLNQAITRTGAKVVVSSSWRGDGHGIAMLRFAGLVEDAIGETPHGRGDLGLQAKRACELRAAEINAWLQAHPEVQDHVAIDDEDFKFERLVRTNGMEGLLQSDVDEVVVRLT